MLGDMVKNRPSGDWAALRELQAVVDAFSLVPGLDHPARAAALRLVSERLDGAVRRLRDVDGYPGSDHDADLATVGVGEQVEAGLGTRELVEQLADGLHLRLELDVRVVDDQLGHGSPIDSSGAGTPGAGGASPDAPIMVGDGDSGPAAVPDPAAGPLSSGELVIAIANALIGGHARSFR